MSTSNCLNDSNLEVEMGAFLHTTLRRDRKLRVIVRKAVRRGESVATLPPAHHILAALYSSTRHANTQREGGAPIQIEPYHCRCGTVHVRIRALTDVLDGQPIYLPCTPHMREGSLFAQFDGSHLPDVNVGGAGVVTWKRDTVPHPKQVFAEPIAACDGSLHAEIVAAHRALVEGLKERDHCNLNILILQGDCLSIAKHYTGASRLRKHTLLQILDDIWDRIASTRVEVRWSYVPGGLATRLRIFSQELQVGKPGNPLPENDEHYEQSSLH